MTIRRYFSNVSGLSACPVQASRNRQEFPAGASGKRPKYMCLIQNTFLRFWRALMRHFPVFSLLGRENIANGVLPGVELFAQPDEPISKCEIVTPGRPARGEFGGVAAVPLPQIGDNPGIDRDAREVVQQQPAMRRRIGTDTFEADEIVVIEAFG